MSLSRFYKISRKFQPETIVGKGTANNGTATWGESIVKEELPSPPPVDETKQIPEEVSIEPEKEKEPEAPSSQPIPADSPPEPELETEPEKPVYNIEALRDESFALGVAAGIKQAEEDFENGAQTLLRICRELDKLKETILQNSTGEMKQLVMEISEKIIRHSVKEQEETIVATLQDAIQLAVKSDVFQVWINPEDLECLEKKKEDIIENISGLENIIFQPDPNVERGGCKLESSCCSVDATLESQIKIVKDHIMATPPSQETKTS